MNGRDPEHTRLSYTEDGAMGIMPGVVKAAPVPTWWAYLESCGRGIAVRSIPALPGYFVIQLVDKDAEKIEHITTECAGRAVAIQRGKEEFARLIDKVV